MKTNKDTETIKLYLEANCPPHLLCSSIFKENYNTGFIRVLVDIFNIYAILGLDLLIGLKPLSLEKMHTYFVENFLPFNKKNSNVN